MNKMKMHRWVRQFHLWIGAWGAIASVVFGLSGFVLNHRAMLKIPQGTATETASEVIPVPASARASRESLLAWLKESRGITFELRPERGGPGGFGGGGMQGVMQAGPPGARGERREGGGGGPGGMEGRSGMEGRGGAPSRWMFQAGDVRTTYQAEYHPGEESLTLRTTQQSFMAVLNRLHKGIGGGIIWVLLSDSFAIGMVVLGLSGLIMWARGRTPRQMVMSVLGVAVVVFVLVVGSVIV